MIERALVDYYRCPADLVKMSLAGELSGDSGYFRFGSNICYGQSTSGARAPGPRDELHDTLPALTSEDGQLRVPFDPSQVVENLRRERYAVDSRGMESLRQKSWQRPYYSLRRFLPAPLRRALQRTYLRDWKTHSFPRWPVDNTVDQTLEHLLLLSSALAVPPRCRSYGSGRMGRRTVRSSRTTSRRKWAGIGAPG